MKINFNNLSLYVKTINPIKKKELRKNLNYQIIEFQNILEKYKELKTNEK